MKRFFAVSIACTLFLHLPGEAYGKPKASKTEKTPLQTMAEILKKAEYCLPLLHREEYTFCSGFTVSREEVTKLWQKTPHLCEKDIKKMGYKKTVDNVEGWVGAAEWVDFRDSVLPSMTFHPKKVVAFKKSDTVTCLHEWIHVKQGTIAKEPLLSLKHRRSEIKKADAYIDAKIRGVEKLEMAGKHKEALDAANDIQTVVNELNKVKDLALSLDEIEANFFIYQECKHRACTAEEKEAVLLNLYRRKEHLPELFRKEIVEKAEKLPPERRVQSIPADMTETGV